MVATGKYRKKRNPSFSKYIKYLSRVILFISVAEKAAATIKVPKMMETIDILMNFK